MRKGRDKSHDMLTICPTPIGNLEDITARQRDALAGCDIIACEDSRRTGKLLELLGIERSGGSPRLVPYHEHNEEEVAAGLLDDLLRGADVTLVSDAGTPGISDPGYALVRRAAAEGVEIESLPGPAAAVVALAASGLPTDAWQFHGFLPSSQKARRERLEAVDSPRMTLVVYESPKRLVDLLEDVSRELGAERRVCVGRELTKMHEEYVRGTAAEVADEFAGRDRVRGECVVVVAPGPEPEGDRQAQEVEVDALIRALLEQEVSSRTIKEVVSELYDVPRSELYGRIERVKAG